MLLQTHTVAKPWGCDGLPAPFPSLPGERIGEIWFEPPEQLDELLVKYIFTSEKLSVQCHPSDAQTVAAGLGKQGKEECWLVVSTEPGAQLGIGFREEIDSESMRRAALDGSIEQLMTWYDVQPGDFFYIPANTVHAIGAGVTLVEVQQNSDITYRLYDYGRPRELHLEQGIAVAAGRPYEPRFACRLPGNGHAQLVDGPFFRLDRVDGIPDEALLYSFARPLLVIPLRGQVLTSDGSIAGPGQCAYAPDLASVTLAQDGMALVACPI